MLSKPDKNGEVQVQVGIIKLSVRLDDIRLSNEKTEKKTNVKVEYNPANTVGLELDIRGMLVDEAKPIVDKYLLDAHLQGLSEVNIIHGCASRRNTAVPQEPPALQSVPQRQLRRG